MITYYETGTNTNITALVTGNGWFTGARTPGLSKGLYVKIMPTAAVTAGIQKTITLTAISLGNPSYLDVVRAVATATIAAKPDLWLRPSTEAVYSGNNVYSADGANQMKNLTAVNGATAMFLFQVQNDGTAVDTFTVTGSAGGSGWTVTYRETGTGIDITDAVTGAGWTVSALAKGGTKGLYAQIVPHGIAAGGAKTLTITAVSATDGTKKDVVRTVTTVVTPAR